MIETQRENSKTIFEIVEDIKRLARAESREWAEKFCAYAGIVDGPTLQQATHAAYAGELNTRERLRSPRETAIHGGDLEDCAVFAICLAEALELSYEIRIKGGTLFLFVHGIEVLHKPS